MYDNFEKHPIVMGLISSASSVGFSIVGLLSEESTVRFLMSVGAILGIIVSCLSIIIGIKKIINK